MGRNYKIIAPRMDWPHNFMPESDFTKKVYAALRRVPRGQVISYQDLAKLAGRPRAYRAVGNIMHNNPYAPAVPCHRVVRSDGRIGGFAGGVKKKIRLLRGEGVIVKDGKIVKPESAGREEREE